MLFYVFPDFHLLDLSGPLTVFQIASDRVPGAYELDVVSARGGAVRSSAEVVAATARPSSCRGDTLVLSGGRGVHTCAASLSEVARIARLATRARRTVSVCTGAFLLAATGLLDGRRVTTHWGQATRLQTAYPSLRVEADRIFCEDGKFWSSAGICAGIDLALALVEADLGTDVARAVARHMVVYHRRPGGQSQFSLMIEMEPSSDRVQRVLHYAREHLRESLSVERLADVARLSPRQFGRLFLAETGHTPANAVERLRVEAARPMVEESSKPLEAVANAAGFANVERLRQGFLRTYGQPPQAIRRRPDRFAPARCSTVANDPTGERRHPYGVVAPT